MWLLGIGLHDPADPFHPVLVSCTEPGGFRNINQLLTGASRKYPSAEVVL